MKKLVAVQAIENGFMGNTNHEQFCTKDKVYSIQGINDKMFAIIDDRGMLHWFDIEDPSCFKLIYEDVEDFIPVPLGVIPRNIFEEQRVQELCRALYDYSRYKELKVDLMHEWAEELVDRLFNLKYE